MAADIPISLLNILQPLSQPQNIQPQILQMPTILGSVPPQLQTLFQQATSPATSAQETAVIIKVLLNQPPQDKNLVAVTPAGPLSLSIVMPTDFNGALLQRLLTTLFEQKIPIDVKLRQEGTTSSGKPRIYADVNLPVLQGFSGLVTTSELLPPDRKTSSLQPVQIGAKYSALLISDATQQLSPLPLDDAKNTKKPAEWNLARTDDTLQLREHTRPSPTTTLPLPVIVQTPDSENTQGDIKSTPQTDLLKSDKAIAAITQPVTVVFNKIIQPGDKVPAPPRDLKIAEVVMHTPAGSTVIQTGKDTLIISPTINLPVGSKMFVAVEAGNPQAMITAPTNDSALDDLQTLLDTIAQVAPRQTQDFIDIKIPQPSNHLGSALLFFLSAFRQGTFEGWVNKNLAEAMNQAQKNHLITALIEKLKNTQYTSTEDGIGEWRTASIPLLYDGHLQHLFFHIRDREHHDSYQPNRSVKGERATRFLIEFSLTRLGNVQLDGLNRSRQLDLVLRVQKQIDENNMQAIRTTFQTGMEAIGYTGSINFQSGSAGWVVLRRPHPKLHTSV